MQETLLQLQQFPFAFIILLFILENSLIAATAITIGFWIDGNVHKGYLKVSSFEWQWVVCTVFFNAMVTLAGYELFLYHHVVFDFGFQPLTIMLDFILLIALMDLLMYLFHWLIHKVQFIKQFHDLHHRYNEPTAVSLFVLHPLEVLGFGILWLLLLCLFRFSFYATIIYLVFNVVMGLIGHLEKEFIPKAIKYNRYMSWLATTSFHRDHHMHDDCNFGFYTSFWDRLFGTWVDWDAKGKQ